jgi:hypothetical protein
VRSLGPVGLVVGVALAVGACGFEWPSATRPAATVSAPSASTSRAADVRLDVRMAGAIGCASFPYGCAATVSVLPADARVSDAWRPPTTDPVWVPDYSAGGTTDHFVATPSGGTPTISPGRHLIVVSLLGSYDAPSFNPDGTVATDLLARCSTDVTAVVGSPAVSAVVTFTPGSESFRGSCWISVERS